MIVAFLFTVARSESTNFEPKLVDSSDHQEKKRRSVHVMSALQDSWALTHTDVAGTGKRPSQNLLWKQSFHSKF